jgi:lipopolysaccharide assembly outer membrane protein LptD (OstA)
MAFNFKTKKGFIQNTYTAQGNGFMQSTRSKRTDDGIVYLEKAKYTTCDAEHPHFYLAVSRAKMRPGKDVVFGPAHLVVEDVPLPLAIPYGFFPFNKKYSSGFLMPTIGDETTRGFYLRDGGYYFALSDYMDLRLLGEIYTKGSWGLSAETNYRKRYRYNGNFYVSYLNTVEGEKNMPDYSKQTSLKIQWTHAMDSKAVPNTSFSARVNFASQNYERNNILSMYDPVAYSQSTRASAVSFSRTFPNIGLNLAMSTNLTQNMRDSTIAMTLPDLSISVLHDPQATAAFMLRRIQALRLTLATSVGGFIPQLSIDLAAGYCSDLALYLFGLLRDPASTTSPAIRRLWLASNQLAAQLPNYM